MLDLAARGVHRRTQLAHGGIEADEDGSRDHMMSDVQLLDLGDDGDRSHVVRREAVPGMYRQSKRRSERRRVTKCIERRALAGGMRIAARVQLDRVGTQVAGLGNTVSI